jgi:hypothetical protein
MDVQENSNNMKQCKNCSNEFEPKHETRGHEQIYCSIKCRTDAYRKRNYDKVKVQDETPNQLPNIQRSEYTINPNGNIIPNGTLDIIEGKYQAKTEALEYKLRYEQSQRELEECRRKIIELESELDEYENDDESDNSIGSFMEFAKSSPELGNALGKLMQNEKVQNFIISIIPDTTQNQ